MAQKQIKLMVYGWIRIIYSNNNDKKHIPLTIQNIINEFTQKCFRSSSILNLRQDLDLIQLLIKQLRSNYISKEKKIQIGDLIYRASDHDFNCEQFHDKFNEEKYKNLAGNVVIIKSNTSNIFGGFTSKCWDVNTSEKSGPIEDKYALLFLLKSDRLEINVPATFRLKSDHQSEAIYCYRHCGPIFGGGHDIFIGERFTEHHNKKWHGLESYAMVVCPERQSHKMVLHCKTHFGFGAQWQSPNSSTLHSYYNENYRHIPWTRSIAGGNASTFKLQDYEVFGII